MENRKNLRKKISQGKVKEVLLKLEVFFQKKPNESNCVLELLAEWNRCDSDFNRNVISSEDYSLRTNKVISEAIKMIDLISLDGEEESIESVIDSAAIVIKRNKEWYSFSPAYIFLNGKHVDTITKSESKEFKIIPGQVKILIKGNYTKSLELEFKIKENEVVQCEVRSNKFGKFFISRIL